MKLLVTRTWETSKSICGELLVDGQFECFTLEPARLAPVNPNHPCIPAGTYPLIMTPSPHLGYITPELINVPGRTDIRIHIANYPKDVLGCTAVGDTHSENYVGQSAVAFKRLMVLLRTATDGWEITYADIS